MLHLAHAYILHTVNVNPCHYNHLIFFLSSLLINQQTTSQNRSRSWSVLEWFPRKSPRMKRGARALLFGRHLIGFTCQAQFGRVFILVKHAIHSSSAVPFQHRHFSEIELIHPSLFRLRQKSKYDKECPIF